VGLTGVALSAIFLDKTATLHGLLRTPALLTRGAHAWIGRLTILVYLAATERGDLLALTWISITDGVHTSLARHAIIIFATTVLDGIIATLQHCRIATISGAGIGVIAIQIRLATRR